MKIRKKIWKSLKWPLLCIGAVIFLAIFADFLANEKPLYCVYEGHHYFPAFSSLKTDTIINSSGKEEVLRMNDIKWDKVQLSFAIWAPIPYSPDTPDKLLNDNKSPFDTNYKIDSQDNRIVSPFYYRHHLGTDNTGKDLLARLIHGSRTSLVVSLIAVSMAIFLGILLGTLAAYWGDNQLKISLSSFILFCISLLFAYYYSFTLRQYVLLESAEKSFREFLGSLFASIFIAVIIILMFQGIAKLLKKGRIGQRVIKIPVDSGISRIIELMDSLPTLLLLLTIAAIFKPNLYLLALVIGVTAWTGVARFARAEVLRISELEYVQAGRAMGFPTWRIMFKHVIPHALTPIWIIIAFSIGNIIISEAALSFIGVGVPEDVVSWGKLLPKTLSTNTIVNKWWLALFPGLAIFFTVLSVNIVGEKLRDLLDPKNK